MRRLSVFDRYYVFLDGIFDWTGVCYLLSVTVFFLLLTVLSLEKGGGANEGEKQPRRAARYVLFAADRAESGDPDSPESDYGKLPASWTQRNMSQTATLELSEQAETFLRALDQDISVYWIVRSGQEDIYLERFLARVSELNTRIEVEKTDPVLHPGILSQYTSGSVDQNSLIAVCGQKANISATARFTSEPLTGTALSASAPKARSAQRSVPLRRSRRRPSAF